jgi:DNA-binding SARP family transcriptional activator/tetratricopeptide (TPR) repeat protein
MTLRLRLLGGFEARVDDGPPVAFARKKAQALLAYLALPPDRAHPRDKLAALLWGDMAPEAARHSLRQALLAIRQALPADMTPLVADVDVISLTGDAVATDVADFARFSVSGDHDSLSAAADLYHGDLLAGIGAQSPPFEEWLLAERARLHELAIEGLARLLAHQMKQGLVELAIRTAARILVVDPLQEPVHRTLMRLYAQHGRRAAALRQYQICITTLQRELGSEPEPETKRLYQELLPLRAPEPAKDAPTRGPRRRAIVTRADVPPVHEAPLIGREQERARLRDALDATARGQGRVVAILGEAGIGKSSLLAAFAAEAEERGARVLLGRSHESEQILPFGPWVDAFRTGHVVDDEEILSALGPVWRAELARLFPEVHAPGLPAAADDARRLFEAVAHLVEHLATTQLLVLLLEDVHWGDEMSLRLLAFLGRQIRSTSVMIVATAREEEMERAPNLWPSVDELSREPHFVTLSLSPLSQNDTAVLVRALARAGSGDASVTRLSEQIWRLSEGNPFVVVEAMRGLAGPETLERPLTLSLPDRVRQLITSRLARLGDRSRQIVAVAAVIGREFDFALLQQAAGFDANETAGALEELVRRRAVTGVGERFDFVHDRIREVVYQQILPSRRRLLHAAVATAIEALHADDLEPQYAALGAHCREGEMWEKAVVYLRGAGRQAIARSAYREAAACFEQAVDALARVSETRGRLEQAIDLRFDLRNALLPLGELALIHERLREAEGFAATLEDQRRLGLVSSYLAGYFWTMGDHERSIEAGERAHDIASRLGDVGLEVASNLYLGVVHHSLGDHLRSLDLLRRNFSARERFGFPYHPSVLSQAWSAWSLAELGYFADAAVHGDEAVTLAESVDQRCDLLIAYFGVGCLHLIKGDFDRATSWLEKSVALTLIGDFQRWSAIIGSHLGAAYVLSGRVSDGLSLLEKVLDPAVSKRTAYHPRLLTLLGEAYVRADRVLDAMAPAQRSLELARARKERGYEAYALRLIAEIAACRDPADMAHAEAEYHRALALADTLGMRPLVARCHLGLGNLYGRTGRTGEADTELSIAAEQFAALQMSFSAGLE